MSKDLISVDHISGLHCNSFAARGEHIRTGTIPFCYTHLDLLQRGCDAVAGGPLVVLHHQRVLHGAQELLPAVGQRGGVGGHEEDALHLKTE